MPMKARTIRLPEWMWEALAKISEEELTSIASIIRKAVKEYLKKRGYKVEE